MSAEARTKEELLREGISLRSTAILAGLVAMTLASAASAQTLKPELAGVGFLVGDWSTGQGKVADPGGTSTGRSRIEWVAGGAVLLRRDHTELFDASGKPAGGFDQIMMIYPEAGTLRADYADGTHVIHYVTASVEAGHSVTLSSAVRPDAPTFRLTYTLRTPTTLDVAFSMAPPGSDAFRPVATGTLEKAP
jgi:hypothetical protein